MTALRLTPPLLIGGRRSLLLIADIGITEGTGFLAAR